jgi:hypothetical protein
MFTKKQHLTIVLKSGKEIKFTADDMKIVTKGNELVEYSIKGECGLFYCKIDEIAAILKDS